MATRVKRSNPTVIYLYGVTQKIAKDLGHTVGIDGASAVESLPLSGLTCWISRVSRTDFADQLQRNMENLDWLANATIHATDSAKITTQPW